MPHGVFTILINYVLCQFIHKFVVLSLDGIFVFSRSLVGHEQHARFV